MYINLQLFGGRGGSSGAAGGGYAAQKGAGYEGNFIPEDEHDAAILQNLVELRERWGRKIGSNNPDDHLVSRYVIMEWDNGKQRQEYFIGTRMQLSDELNRRNESHGRNIRSNSNKYFVNAVEDRAHTFKDGSREVISKKDMDKELDGPKMREIWKKSKTPY